MPSTAFENLKKRQTELNPESVKTASAFDVLKQRQSTIAPESIQTKEQQPQEKSTLRKIGDFFTGSTQKFGKTSGEAIAAPGNVDIYNETQKSHDDVTYNLSKKIAQDKAEGKDTTRLQEAMKRHVESAPKVEDFTGDVINKTTGQVLGEAAGTVLEATSGGLLSSGAKTVASKTLSTLGKVKQGAKIGSIYGAVGGGADAMQEGGGVGETAIGAVTGGLVGGALGGGLGFAGAKIGEKIAPTSKQLTSKLDKNIKNIFKGTTGDVNKINESAFKAKKGLELLVKESKDLTVPDAKAPLGSKATKPLNIKKSTPNELLSSVLEMDKKIAGNARQAVEKAKTQGLTIDTFEAESLVNQAVKSGEIPKATGSRLLQQIKSAGDDPVKIHDWVQDVNAKYGKKYQRGTIDDTATGKIADDIAEIFRKKLDVIVDRKGYAEAFSNNQELKRMLVAIAKKANKGVNFGDIGTDAGLDAGIALLTGNPAYMARTLGTGLFRGLLSGSRNLKGIKSFKKAAEITRKLPTLTKLPSSQAKESTRLMLPAPKNEFRSQMLSGKPIRLGSKSASTVEANELKNLSLGKSHKGSAKLPAILGGAAVTGSLALGSIPSKTEYKSKPSLDLGKSDKKNDKLVKAIAYNETNTIPENKKYSYSKPSGKKEYGNDNGKYQVTDEELRVYGQRFLGKKITTKEFLDNPTVQDEYVKNKIKWLKDKGLTDEEVLAVHRSGMSDLTRESLDKKLKDRASYVREGMNNINQNNG